MSVQNPIAVLESRPESDVLLLVPREDFYDTLVPRATDVLLLIEVADSSLENDRTEKLSLYAEAGVREYWFANLNDECVEAYRSPQPDGTYADTRVLKLGERLDIVKLPGVVVAVDQVFKARENG